MRRYILLALLLFVAWRAVHALHDIIRGPHQQRWDSACLGLSSTEAQRTARVLGVFRGAYEGFLRIPPESEGDVFLLFEGPMTRERWLQSLTLANALLPRRLEPFAAAYAPPPNVIRTWGEQRGMTVFTLGDGLQPPLAERFERMGGNQRAACWHFPPRGPR